LSELLNFRENHLFLCLVGWIDGKSFILLVVELEGRCTLLVSPVLSYGTFLLEFDSGLRVRLPGVQCCLTEGYNSLTHGIFSILDV
jgi:hypothetical protein